MTDLTVRGAKALSTLQTMEPEGGYTSVNYFVTTVTGMAALKVALSHGPTNADLIMLLEMAVDGDYGALQATKFTADASSEVRMSAPGFLKDEALFTTGKLRGLTTAEKKEATSAAAEYMAADPEKKLKLFAPVSQLMIKHWPTLCKKGEAKTLIIEQPAPAALAITPAMQKKISKYPTLVPVMTKKGGNGQLWTFEVRHAGRVHSASSLKKGTASMMAKWKAVERL